MGLFMPQFEQADNIESGKATASESERVIREALKAMGALQ
jgi:hypothetical protein